MPLYYCHQCRRSVNLRDGDLRCSICNGEFIEETAVPRIGVRVEVNSDQNPQAPQAENPEVPPQLDSWIRNMFRPEIRQQQPQEEEPAGAPNAFDGSPNFFQLTSNIQMNGVGVQPISFRFRAPAGTQDVHRFQQVVGRSFEEFVGRFPDILQEAVITVGGVDGAGSSYSHGFPDEMVQRYLPMTTVSQRHVDNGSQCATCFDTFKIDEEVASLDCEHIFHRPCIEPWLKRKSSCPVCRRPINMNEWKTKYEESQRNALINTLEDLD